ncbi:hypothetical protein [Psychrobacillus lasiicapitis]|uniref:Uncharacterized protein n=1 Tax=Psychrobacillus lasiicapitis TaxID=1636719 RepID=A0A544SZX6_9BACI|nr:hypothetical protein [Psychrobacillus lasiicapitis]TQR10762.1 hypothetical protein FG382_17020 [Psychrobacillus lasiicapitis]GGA42676.1 hypothetical protein GCM10011384_35540 [Psychrobacillus lasiicapitis]
MNERLVEFLFRSEVAKLRDDKREFYQFIINIEDTLAERAENAEEFCQLLLKYSPVDVAASRFNLSYDRVVQRLEAIDAELHQKIEARSQKVEWIDYTHHFPLVEGKRVFLFKN